MSMLIDSYRFGGAWSPASLPGLVLWLDPSDSSTMTIDNGTVLSMADKSPSALTLTPWVTAPAVGTVNGLPAVFIASSGNSLRATQTIAQPLTVVCVFKCALLRASQSTVSWRYSNGALNTGIGITDGIKRWRQYSGKELLGDLADTLPHCGAAIANGTSSQLRLDGSVMATGTPTLPGLGGSGSATLFVGSHGDIEYFAGHLGEIVATNNAMAPSDITKLETYLMSKWGI